MNYKRLLPICLLFVSLSSNAEERWFEVELLLFQRNAAIDAGKEDLIKDDINIDTSKSIPLVLTEEDPTCHNEVPDPQQAATAITDNTVLQENVVNLCYHKAIPTLIEAQQFASQENGFKYLANDQLQLTPEREKLEKHASFKPLLHLVWQMPVKSSNTAKPIHLFAGENFAINGLPKEQADPLFPTMETGDKWAIDGNFKIYLEHYLFIDSQLIIRQKVTQNIIPANKPEAQFEVINSDDDVQVVDHNDPQQPQSVQQETVLKEALFSQNRRLRSGEIHYFDHPLMGMIVQIRKIPAK